MALALIRHPAIRLPPGICYGRRDFPLADPADVAAIVGRLGDFRAARIFASPSGRCHALAEAIPGPVTYDPRLLELDFGAWEGLAWDDVDRIALDRWAADPRRHAPPGGETGQSLIDRVTAVFEEIRLGTGNQVIVTHGGPLKVLLCLAAGVPIDLMAQSVPPGSITLDQDRF